MILTVRDISKLLGVSGMTIRRWCRNKILRSYHNGPNTNWFIDLKDFIDFLGYNPELQDEMNTRKLSFPNRILRDRINSQLSKKEKFLTLNQIADILSITKQGVWYYVQVNLIAPSTHRTSANGMLISEKDFHAFLKAQDLRDIKELKKREHIRSYMESHNL